MLKMVKCFVQPSKLDVLKQSLLDVGVEGMSISDVRGFGRQRGYAEGETPAEVVKFRPKLKVEIVVSEEIVQDVVSLIMRMARTGTVGAGKIFVLPVEDAIRIGTGETGRSALY